MVNPIATDIHSYWLLLHFLVIISEECQREKFTVAPSIDNISGIDLTTYLTNFLDPGSADRQIFLFTHGMGFWLACLPFIVTAHSTFSLDILGQPVSGMTGEVSTAKVSGKKETFPVAQKKTLEWYYSNQDVTISFSELHLSLE